MHWGLWHSGLLILMWSFTSTIVFAQKRASNAAPSFASQLFVRNFDEVPRKAMDSYPAAFDISARDRPAYRKDSIALYRGIALLKSGRTSEALPYLRRVAERYSTMVSNVSEWYLALCYLRMEQVDHAEYYFHKVAETEVHPYQNESEIVYQALLSRKR